ncbi:MAG: hypothetical protein KBC36_07980 [Spirochaetia bacterium]|nr:hypothetical protein [Spirochaetia bacterium]
MSEEARGGPATFVASLAGTLLLENFPARALAWVPARPLAELVEDPDALRAELGREARALGWPEETVAALDAAFLDRHASGPVASRAFALHLFRVAEDNWFGFARAVEAASWFEAPEYHAERRELWLAKGVPTRDLMEGRLTPPDLAVIADLGTGELAFVLAGLAD